MTKIDKSKYPLLDRMAGGLFQGLGRTISSEDELPRFLLTFFRESEIEALRAELEEILSKNLNDKEWEEYWYNSSAYSFPKNAKSSNRLLQMVVEETRRHK